MPLWNPTTWAPGTALTGALLNTFFDSIGTALTDIVMNQIDPRARFPVGMFEQKHAPCVVALAGFDVDGQAVAQTLRFRAPNAGTYRTADGVALASADGTSLGTDDPIEAGAEITVTIAAGEAGAIHFEWGVTG